MSEKENLFVLDTSAFFLKTDVSGKLFTTHDVVSELKDLRSRARYEALLADGLVVREPERLFLDQIKKAALRTGDETVLSETDTGILALALEIKGVIVTDDFAVQNTAALLKIPIKPIIQRRAKQRTWVLKCTGCGRVVSGDRVCDVCDVCGSPVKRRFK